MVEGGARRQQEIEDYHKVLEDVSMCRATQCVRAFCVNAYVRGACVTARNTDYEGSTSVFSKRRYRDKFNRAVVRQA